VDDLPRLEAIDALRAKYPGQELEITLPSHSRAMNEVRKQSIRRALIRHQGVSISFLNESQPRWFDRLHYVTPISYHPSVKSPRAIEYLRRALAPLDVKPRPSRIFVTRRTERGRRLSNLDVVRPFLEKRGFSIVDPEGMDFAEQVATFSAASIVVGSMGAAMTNTLFCPPQSTMIYLAPLGWVEPFYWDLARVSEHGYHVVYGQTERSAAPPHQRAFEISLEALTTLLDAVT
jgi:capsular polysaccharide biosynthesis protein